jgi:transglutaminase-like putative cysteine protease
MIYDITLSVTHDYAGAVGTGRHLLRIVPADLPGRQKLRAQVMDVTPPPAERYGHSDFFGNRGVMIVHDQSHEEMVIRLASRVEILPPEQGFDIAPPLPVLAAEIAHTLSLGPDSPHHFLGASPRIVPDKAMAAYAKEQISDGMGARDVVAAIGQALNRDMAFCSGTTTVETTPQEAFAQRRGVCQDFSHIMITCLREIGVPAGYVSGYLRTRPPPGKPRLDGADAMHAWVRVWCGVEAGWLEYDPTNAMFAGTDHIVIAAGRDYDDVAPVKGVLMASGGQKSAHSVDVVPHVAKP